MEANSGYSGGIDATEIGSFTINKANGYVTLTPNSSTGWGPAGSKSSASASISHHGGSLSWRTGGSNFANLNVSISGNTLYLSRDSKLIPCHGATVTVTSAVTTNYNAASATFYCNN